MTFADVMKEGGVRVGGRGLVGFCTNQKQHVCRFGKIKTKQTFRVRTTLDDEEQKDWLSRGIPRCVANNDTFWRRPSNTFNTCSFFCVHQETERLTATHNTHVDDTKDIHRLVLPCYLTRRHYRDKKMRW